MRKLAGLLLFAFVALAAVRAAQHRAAPAPAAPGDRRQAPTEHDAGSIGANRAMQGTLEMGPHMRLTAPRPASAADAQRAAEVAAAARRAIEKYRDFHSALDDGYKIFLPNVRQRLYHFTNYSYALEAAIRFNPEHPSSLLYEKDGDGYTLVGAMYTAPARFTEEQLDARIPLSVARWHLHTNLCLPPRDRRQEMFQPHPRFGLNGSVAGKAECDAAGGKFYEHVFGWMVHVYPFASDPQQVWALDHASHMGDMSMPSGDDR